MRRITKTQFLDTAGRLLWPYKNKANIGVRTTTLPNGVRVATRYLPHEPMTDILVMVGIGSRDEASGNHPSGVAHFFEHMPFRGSMTPSGKEFAPHEAQQEIAKLGGRIGAATGLDDTTYWANTPSNGVSAAISMLASMVCHPKLAESEIELERPAIHVEWLESQLDIEKQQRWRTLQTAYSSHSLTQHLLGTEESILSIKQADLLAFHVAKYKGNNTAIVIEGDIDHDTVVAQLKKEFDLPLGDKSPVSLPAYTGGSAAFPEVVKGTRVRLGFNYESHKDHDVKAAYSMVAEILGGGSDSMLLQALRSTRGLVYGVECANESFNNLLAISFNTFPTHVDTSLQIIRDELDKLRAGVDPNLLEQKKRASALQFQVYSTQSKIGTSGMAKSLLEEGKVQPRDYFFRKYQSVTPESIKQAVEQMLQNPITLVVGGDVSRVPDYEKVREMFSTQSPSTPGVSGKIISPDSIGLLRL